MASSPLIGSAPLAATLEADYAVDCSPLPTGGAVATAKPTYRLVALCSEETPSIAFDSSTAVTIGRDKKTCDIALPDEAVVSRQHCYISSLGGDIFIDDRSSNGTFVNKALLGKGNKRRLLDGDVIHVAAASHERYEKLAWRVVSPQQPETPVGHGSATTEVEKRYIFGPVLGTGNFAAVKLGTCRATGRKVAIKVVDKKRFALQPDQFSFSMLESEVEILRKMRHENIISMFDVFDDPKALTIVLELVEGGDLFDYVVGRGAPPFSEKDAKIVCGQLIDALLYMHSKDVVHRDLKPENVLVCVDEAWRGKNEGKLVKDHQANAKHIPVSAITLKVTDFGLAKFCGEHSVMATMCGTQAYLAPEVAVHVEAGTTAPGYTRQVDIWSVGVMFYILLSGIPPKDPHSGKISFAAKQFANVSMASKDLVRQMMTVDPARRITLRQILEHPAMMEVTFKSKELVDLATYVPGVSKLTLQPTMLKIAPTMLVPPVPKPKAAAGAAADGEASDGTELESDDGDAPAPSKRAKKELPKPQAVWEWKADLDADDTAPDAWKPYSDKDCAELERLFQRGCKSGKIGDGTYRVSFKDLFQYHSKDTTKQRPVRRRVVPPS